MYNTKLTAEQAQLLKLIIESATFSGKQIKNVAELLKKTETILIKHFKTTGELVGHPDDPLFKDLK
tara:strand:+ start:314 stop:511 length:198 start_codon:yes stop_codon:yes gene_type:complete